MDWNARYLALNTPWQRPSHNPAFLHWFVGNAKTPVRGKEVLVPGCGTAPEPLAFAKAGAYVTAIDVAPAAIDSQERAFAAAGLNASLITANLTLWRPIMPFDIIYEQTCLCAVSPDDRVAYERFVYESLAPGGMLFALFMQTGVDGGPPYHCDPAAMKSLFSGERWRWPEDAPFHSAHPSGAHELGYRLTRIS